MACIFFVFKGSLLVLIRTTVTKSKHIVLLILEWLVYGLHLLCGIFYFYKYLCRKFIQLIIAKMTWKHYGSAAMYKISLGIQ